jgi:Protein of unknown function (DUF4231)
MSSRKTDPGAPDVGTPLSIQLDYLEQLIKPYLKPAQFQYWSNVWKAAVYAAAKKIHDNRIAFYRFQGISSAAAVIIPALVGLNLSGTGGVAVRWITFAVGLIGALAAAALQLFRYGSRWRINRHYYSDLIRTGRNFGMDVAASGTCEDGKWKKFQSEIGNIIEQYNNVYDSEVISATQPSGALQ